MTIKYELLKKLVVAAVLPICYLAYACNGDLTGSTGKQRKLMRMASREAYTMLKAQGMAENPGHPGARTAVDADRLSHRRAGGGGTEYADLTEDVQ